MKKLEQEKGSITIFVLVSMLFFVLFLSGMYMLSTSKEQAGISETARIKEIYEKDVNQVDDVYATLANTQKVNPPVYQGVGFIPVTIESNGTLKEADTTDSSWYSYDGKQNHWANAKTADGSMFVWIPRFAYKITYTNTSDKSKGGNIDVVFLKGITNLDFNGNDVTNPSYVDEKGKTGSYIVHPAFQDGSSNKYANGEWNREITGFWMAKFEAGYAGTAGDKTSAIDSKIALSIIKQWNGSTMVDLTSNYYGTRKIGDLIKYPVFQANRPSMNNLGISDAYDLCMAMNDNNNPYGLTSKADSHLTKNSEWGAVVYLTQSKYGRNGEEVTINNVNANNTQTIYAVTGYGASSISASEDKSRTLETLLKQGQSGSWTTTQGQNAASTKNIYGIYDLSGGLWEWTAGYIATTGADDCYNQYGGSLKGDSNKYKSKYAGTSSTDTANYSASPNPTRVGEAIWEISTNGTGTSSWNADYSIFTDTEWSFIVRGGRWQNAQHTGIFAFSRDGGYCVRHVGFRPVVVVE